MKILYSISKDKFNQFYYNDKFLGKKLPLEFLNTHEFETYCGFKGSSTAFKWKPTSPVVLPLSCLSPSTIS